MIGDRIRTADNSRSYGDLCRGRAGRAEDVDLLKIFGKEAGHDTTAALRNANLLASGPSSPKPGRPIAIFSILPIINLQRCTTAVNAIHQKLQ